jgi:hypothetical protein
MPVSSQCSPSFSFPHQNSVCVSLLPVCATFLASLILPDVILVESKSLDVLIQFYPVYYY